MALAERKTSAPKRQGEIVDAAASVFAEKGFHGAISIGLSTTPGVNVFYRLGFTCFFYGTLWLACLLITDFFSHVLYDYDG